VCEQCSLEAVECVYEFLPGQTRLAMLRVKNERLQGDLNTMMKLYRFVPSLCMFRLILGPNIAQVPADAEEGRCGPGAGGYPVRCRP
jgi:hypothetical protein